MNKSSQRPTEKNKLIFEQEKNLIYCSIKQNIHSSPRESTSGILFQFSNEEISLFALILRGFGTRSSRKLNSCRKNDEQHYYFIKINGDG